MEINKNYIKLVVFDLDGTLIQAKGLIGNCINQTLEKFGYSKIEKEKFRGLIGIPLAGIFKIGGVNNKKDIDDMIKYYHKLYLSKFKDKTVVNEGIAELLKKLKANGIKICVVTLKNGDVARKVIKEMGLDFLVDIVIGDGDSKESKPSPEQITYVCKKLGIENKNAIVVGDTKIDIIAGKRAGCRTIGVLWGFGSKNELKNAGADFLIFDVNELENFLIYNY